MCCSQFVLWERKKWKEWERSITRRKGEVVSSPTDLQLSSGPEPDLDPLRCFTGQTGGFPELGSVRRGAPVLRVRSQC